MSEPFSTGTLIAYWDSRRLIFGRVRNHQKDRLEIITEGKKKLKIASGRIAHATDDHETVAEWQDQLTETAQTIDIEFLWELAQEERGPFTAQQIARWVGDDPSETLITAIDWLLFQDAIHFGRKGEQWEVRSADAVSQLTLQREQEILGAERRQAWLDKLRHAIKGDAPPEKLTEWEQVELKPFVDFAIEGEDTAPAQFDKAKRWYDLLESRGPLTPGKAFTIAFAFGVFTDPHQNLDLMRFDLKREFDPEIEVAAEDALFQEDRGGVSREDWTEMPTLTVDDAWTTEVDDALAWQVRPDGSMTLAIMVADPTSWILPGSPLADVALKRKQTLYLPDQKLPMLPPILSESKASLVAHELRSALAFILELSPSADILERRITPVWIQVNQALSYEAVDERLAEQDATLTPLFEMLGRLIAKRKLKTPPLIELDEISLRVENGDVQVVRHDANSRSSAGIREAMVLANEIAGERLQSKGLPAIFRGQEESEMIATDFEFKTFGLKWAQARERRMGMNRAQMVREAKPHFGLGAEAYAQSSSPLRRLADLINHWQLWSTISDEPPLDVKRINEALQFAEHGERRGRKLERRANRYWTLEAIRQAGKGPFRGWVLANEPYPKIGLEDWMLEVEHKDAAQWNVGDELEIEVVRVNPRDDRLKLRCVNISAH